MAEEVALWYAEEDRIPRDRLAGLAVDRIPRALSAGLALDRIPRDLSAGLAVGRIPRDPLAESAGAATVSGCCDSRRGERGCASPGRGSKQPV